MACIQEKTIKYYNIRETKFKVFLCLSQQKPRFHVLYIYVHHHAQHTRDILESNWKYVFLTEIYKFQLVMFCCVIAIFSHIGFIIAQKVH